MKNWTGNHRARNHDYASKCLYHITMMKAKDIAAFGRLAGDYRLSPSLRGSSYIEASPTGRAIKQALRLIPEIHPALRIYQYALMPDHLHFVIAAEDRLDEAIGRNVVANGGVLVSPFISREEKEIRKMAEEIDGRIILISNEPLGERQKPHGNNFARCASGNLLILTPTNPPLPASLSRTACLAMNSLAALISNS